MGAYPDPDAVGPPHPAPHVLRLGSGMPVLFVHGNGVDHRLALALDDAFDEVSGFERLYLDLPGFGETPALDAPGGLPEFAQWLEDAARSLVGGAEFAVVGTSLGGLLARDLAARLKGQCRGIALLAPVIDSVRAHRTVPEPTVILRDPALVDSLDPADAEAYTELAVIQSPQNWERFRHAVLPGIRAANETAMERLAAIYELPSLPDNRLAGFEHPVLIVAGKQDAVVGFQDQWELAQRFPRCTYAMLDGAGHNIQIDQPGAVKELLSAWAADVLAFSRPA